jgi:hypothetical protein
MSAKINSQVTTEYFYGAAGDPTRLSYAGAMLLFV